jgi:hypothetical protein
VGRLAGHGSLIDRVGEAQPWIEVLAEDYALAAALLQSLVVAVAQRPAHLGTVRHLEQAAQEILRDLRR